MENIDKLIIITSLNGPEFENYWGLKADDHFVVKNGRKKGGFYVASLNPLARHEKLQKKIDENGYLVMIHRQNNPTVEKQIFQKGDKTLEYLVYYYTTQDELLNGDLWSIENNYHYSGPDTDPVCPFDMLRQAIQLEQDTLPAIKRIAEWVGKKTRTANLLEVKLNTLHQCLTPEGAAAVAEVDYYDLIKNHVVADNISVDEFIKKSLTVEKDCFSDNYINRLTQLRDSLLGGESSIKTKLQ